MYIFILFSFLIPEEICICLVLLEPVKIFQHLFTDILKKFLHCPTTSRIFSDPHVRINNKCYLVDNAVFFDWLYNDILRWLSLGFL